MGLFSWLRFIVGIVLALEILRSAMFGGGISGLAIFLSIVFVLLALWFFVEKFVIGS
jgi:hypothetical protein